VTTFAVPSVARISRRRSPEPDSSTRRGTRLALGRITGLPSLAETQRGTGSAETSSSSIGKLCEAVPVRNGRVDHALHCVAGSPLSSE
jgi:hypothetical protein